MSALQVIELFAGNDPQGQPVVERLAVRQNDDDMERYIIKELEAVKMGINTFNESAIDLIIRSAQGNLRLCRNLCYGSLIEACRDTKKTVTISHVNGVLVHQE